MYFKDKYLMDLDPLNRHANNPVDAHINDCEGEFSKTKNITLPVEQSSTKTQPKFDCIN